MTLHIYRSDDLWIYSARFQGRSISGEAHTRAAAWFAVRVASHQLLNELRVVKGPLARVTT